MHSVESRLQAQELRRKGKSIYEIAAKIFVPKSTVSMWCRDIVLSSRHIRILERKQRVRGYAGSLRAAELKRKARIEDVKLHMEKGAKDIGVLSKRDLLILGVGLYWGEGYKYGNSELGFTNSDPRMIRMFLRWLKEIYDIGPKDLILRVSINSSYKARVTSALEHWSGVTGASLSQFTKTSLIKTTLKKFQQKQGQKYNGTLRVKVRRATRLHRRILGSIEHVAQSL